MQLSKPSPTHSNSLLSLSISDNNLDIALEWLKDECKDQDNSDVWHYAQHWQQHKADLQQRIKNGSFTFQTVRDISVKNSDGTTSYREIRSAEDRLLIRAMSHVLKPLIAAVTPKECTHLATRGGIKTAVKDLQQYLSQHPTSHVFKSDIKSYYASISHTILHQQLCELFPQEKALCRLLWQFMQRTVERGSNYQEIEQGLPLGSSLSPLFATLYLIPLDNAFYQQEDIFYRRYMDDWVIVCKTHWNLRKVTKQVYAVLKPLCVEVHPDKTYLGKANKGFDFLGFRVSPTSIQPSMTSVSRRDTKISQLYEQGASKKRIGQYLRRWLGWAILCGAASPALSDPLHTVFHSSDEYLLVCNGKGDYGVTQRCNSSNDDFSQRYIRYPRTHLLGTGWHEYQNFEPDMPQKCVSGAYDYGTGFVENSSQGLTAYSYDTKLKSSTLSALTYVTHGRSVSYNTNDRNADPTSPTVCTRKFNREPDSPFYYMTVFPPTLTVWNPITNVGNVRASDTYPSTPIEVACEGSVTYNACETKALAHYYTFYAREPLTHPTNVTATTNGVNQITLDWVDATSTVTPDAYLVMCNTTGTFISPVDDITLQMSDTNCGDGAGIQNIAHGTESATWIGLDSDTQYYFKIFPFINTGSDVDYKTDGSPQTANATTSNYVVSIAKTTDGAENNTGNPTDAVFTVSVTPENLSGSAITGNIVYSGSASNGTDYATGVTTFSIPDNSSIATITLDVTEDVIEEGIEAITAMIFNPSEGSINTAAATATANLTDDESYLISIAKTTDGAENNTGDPTDAVFTVSVSPANLSGSAITGSIAYSGTATNGTDYATGATIFSIPDNSSIATITLDVTEDVIVEGAETVIAKISAPSIGSISTAASAEAILVDDDVSVDIDTDGISTAVEDAAPNTGDGNNDGIKDGTQGLVTSAKSVSNNDYMTVDASGTSCTALSNVSTITETSLATQDTENYDFEAGLVNFTLTGCTVGGNVDMVFYFHGLTEQPDALRKYGKTPTSPSTAVWYTMPNTTIQPVTIDGKTVYKVSYTITDGGLGDDDLTANGTIIDPVGAALAPAGGAVNGSGSSVKPIPTLSEWTQYLLILLLAGVGVAGGRRKRT